MRPLEHGAKRLSGTAKPPDPLQPDDKLNHFALRQIADTLQKRFGADYAQRWLKQFPSPERSGEGKPDPTEGLEARLEALRSPETEFLARWTAQAAPPPVSRALKTLLSEKGSRGEVS